ncbi:hypothetical protein Tsubulata_032047 [Turnera subulata]|uniref:Uncharacterized protein n=1 Tax=Turnera subulata TaxID=218843 RepID=A0A9Q0JF07_9ROSI|nr:hypothetical protein Tsubulata_032047 [Turnera subulata]
MEGVSARMYTKVKGYWRRRGYERINGSDRRRGRAVELGGGSGRPRRRFWGIKIKPKLKFLKRASPKKFLVWLRDAYVKMMLRVANYPAVSTGFGGVAGAEAIRAFDRRELKEYDEKVIIEIYKSLVAAQGLVPRDPAKLGFGPKLTAIVE